MVEWIEWRKVGVVRHTYIQLKTSLLHLYTLHIPFHILPSTFLALQSDIAFIYMIT